MILDIPYDIKSFAYKDLMAQDRWLAFTVSASLTEVGTATYTGRHHVIGRQCFFQVSIVPGTSVASTAGTNYIGLPLTAKGIGGAAIMSNDTTNIAVGDCHIDVATNRCYLPSQAASGNTFTVAGWYEI